MSYGIISSIETSLPMSLLKYYCFVQSTLFVLAELSHLFLFSEQNVEMHLKLTGGSGRRGQREGPGEVSNKHRLQGALKAAVYGLVNTFGTSLL